MSRFDEYLDYERREAIEKAWETILDNVFHIEYTDIDWKTDPNLKDTPNRIANSLLFERCAGIGSEEECKALLENKFPTTYDGMITMGPLEVHSICPHHFENISYSVYFGYIPNYSNRQVVGLSKPGRVIKLFACQPILQEEYTRKLADIFMKCINPEGIGLIVKGKHMCMGARGLEQPNTFTTTSEMRGCFREVETIKNEFMEFCREGK